MSFVSGFNSETSQSQLHDKDINFCSYFYNTTCRHTCSMRGELITKYLFVFCSQKFRSLATYVAISWYNIKRTLSVVFFNCAGRGRIKIYINSPQFCGNSVCRACVYILPAKYTRFVRSVASIKTQQTTSKSHLNIYIWYNHVLPSFVALDRFSSLQLHHIVFAVIAKYFSCKDNNPAL